MQQLLPSRTVRCLNPVDLVHRRTVAVEELQAFTRPGAPVFQHPEAVAPLVEEDTDVDLPHGQSHGPGTAGLEFAKRRRDFVHHLVIAGQNHHRPHLMHGFQQCVEGGLEGHQARPPPQEHQRHFTHPEFRRRLTDAQAWMGLLQGLPALLQVPVLLLCRCCLHGHTPVSSASPDASEWWDCR